MVATQTFFFHSIIRSQIENGKLELPKPKPLFDGGPDLPCYFLGDGGFALTKYMMRPYPGKNLDHKHSVFNYRHSRGRRTIECAFGILSNKWAILHRALHLNPENVIAVIKACCVLHNFVRDVEGRYGLHDQFGNPTVVSLDSLEIGDALAPLNAHQGNSVTWAKNMRELLANYYTSVGSVPWQDERAY